MEVRAKTIEMVNINSLTPHPKNMNKHSEEQIERLCKIIDYQGFRNPLIVQKGTNLIVAGHGRLLAAKKLKMKEVPVTYQEFESEEQLYACIVSDNAIASWAELDLGMVNAEIENLGPDLDIDLLGIKDFVIEPVEKYDEETEDDVPEVKHEPVTKKGDVWLLGKHRVMCGDSTMIDDVEKLMNGEKADMVFTDPPYGVDYKGINNDSRSGLFELLNSAFANYLALCKSGASIYCFHSDRCADIFHECFRKYFHFSSMIIWNKNSLTLSQTDYQSKHEPCMYGWMSNGTHKFYGNRKQVSVWDIHKESVEGHTTPKPIQLIENALVNSSKARDLISDLFLGSGSTLIACEKTNRKCYGMELDEHYCDVIVERWQKYTGKLAILEGSTDSYDNMKQKRL